MARLRAFPASFLACGALFAAPQTAPPAAIQIRILEGDGAINSIRLHHAHDPVVQVLDASGTPVSGVTVTFLLPALGAGGFHASGSFFRITTCLISGPSYLPACATDLICERQRRMMIFAGADKPLRIFAGAPGGPGACVNA